MENSIRKNVDFGPVIVDKVYRSEFQKEGTKTAQLRQVVKTKSFYPSKQISNNLQDNIFDIEEFGFTEQEFTNTEKRVAWIDIPVNINSVDDVVAKLPEGSCLYKILSNKPVVTDSQSYAISNPDVDLSLESVGNKQIVRYGLDHEKEGQIVLDLNGKPQYRAVFFSKHQKEDQDLRTEDPNDFYVTEIISAEISGANVVPNQSL